MDTVKRHLLRGTVLVPAVLAAATAAKGTAPWALAFAASLFAVIAVLPCARHSENLWMFLLVFVSVIPINLRAIFWFLLEFCPPGNAVLTALRASVAYLLLLSAEELVFAVGARLLWPRQRRVVFSSRPQD